MNRVGESGGSQHCNQFVSRRKVGDALRQVAICRAVGKKCSDLRNDLAEIDPVAEADDGIVGYADVEQRDASTWPDDSGQFTEESVEVDKIAQRETARHAVDGSIGKRQTKNVGLNAWLPAAIGRQHAEAEVDGKRRVAGATEIDAQVAGTCCKIDDTRTPREAECAHGPSAPPNVEAKGHDAVHEVVSRRNRVEHRPHGANLLFTLWKVAVGS